MSCLLLLTPAFSRYRNHMHGGAGIALRMSLSIASPRYSIQIGMEEYLLNAHKSSSYYLMGFVASMHAKATDN